MNDRLEETMKGKSTRQVFFFVELEKVYDDRILTKSHHGIIMMIEKM